MLSESTGKSQQRWRNINLKSTSQRLIKMRVNDFKENKNCSKVWNGCFLVYMVFLLISVNLYTRGKFAPHRGLAFFHICTFKSISSPLLTCAFGLNVFRHRRTSTSYFNYFRAFPETHPICCDAIHIYIIASTIAFTILYHIGRCCAQPPRKPGYDSNPVLVNSLLPGSKGKRKFLHRS